MIKQRKLWMVNAAANEKVNDLKSIGLPDHTSSIVDQILARRGLSEYGQAFLYPSWQDMHDPFQLNDMQEAITRIQQAISKKEKICVYGDYDADGITATALLVSALQSLGASVQYYIPDRLGEGYGLNENAIRLLADTEISLLITVDCGISGLKEGELCRSTQIDLIITDHHEPPDNLPAAIAVINPKRKDSDYPNRELAGVGVAFKLVQALFNNDQDRLEDFFDLVAIGTVADVVPILGENRFFVKEGLSGINSKVRFGLSSLIDVSGLSEKILNEENIGYVLGPRINAAGRVGNPRSAVELLLGTSRQITDAIAFELDQWNRQRQHLEAEICETAKQKILADGLDDNQVIIVAGEDWHAGVIGIVSSRITEEFGRPSIILTNDSDPLFLKGSGRSIEGFDLYQALKRCEQHLHAFGGHEQAAGVKLDRNSLLLFRQQMNEIAREWLSEEDLLPTIHIDMELAVENLTMETFQQLTRLTPFGEGNRNPVFLIRNLKVKNGRSVGNSGAHLKLVFDTGNEVIDSIAFSFGNLAEIILPGDQVDVVCTLAKNVWNGRETLQLMIMDLKSSFLADNLSGGDSRMISIDALARGQNCNTDSELHTSRASKCDNINGYKEIWGNHPLGIYDSLERVIKDCSVDEGGTCILVNTREQCRHIKYLLNNSGLFPTDSCVIHRQMAETEQETSWSEFLKGQKNPLIWTGTGPYLSREPKGLKNLVVMYPFYSKCHYDMIRYWLMSSNKDVTVHYLFNRTQMLNHMLLLKNLYPNREMLAQIYRNIRNTFNGNAGKVEFDLLEWGNHLQVTSNIRVLPEAIVNSLIIFTELNLIKHKVIGRKAIIEKCQGFVEKRELCDSVHFSAGEKIRQDFQQELLRLFPET